MPKVKIARLSVTMRMLKAERLLQTMQLTPKDVKHKH